jgi:membrane-associated phospholipid phosphatase
VDHSARTLAERNQSDLNDNLAEIGRFYGSGLFAFGLSGGVYLGGLAAGNEGVRTTGRMMFESVAFTGLTVVALKSITGRSRPYTEEGSLRFRPFQYQDDYVSLPSGHSALSFALSTVLSRRIHNRYASLALYSISTLTAISRVYEDEHWLSDSVLGAAIGTVIGLTITGLDNDDDHQASLRIIPASSGLFLVYQF